MFLKRGQGAFEYILLVGGVLLIVVIVNVILKSLIFAPAVSNVNGSASILNSLSNVSSVNLTAYANSFGGGGSTGSGSVSCSSDAQCSGSTPYCVNSTCSSSQGGVGDGCSSNYDCLSGNCTGGFCAAATPVNAAWLSVSLVSPLNNSLMNVNYYGFIFIASGSSSSYNCSLYVNGVLEAFNSSTLNNTQTSFSYSSLNSGVNSWSVTCSNSSLSNSSQTFYFTQSSISVFSPANNSVSTNPNPGFNFSVAGSSSTYACYIYMDGRTGSNYHAYNASVLNNTPTTQLLFPGSTPNIGNGLHNYTINCQSNGQWVNSSVLYFNQAFQILVNPLTPASNSVSTNPNPGFNFSVTGPYANGYKCYIYMDGRTGSNYHAYNTTVLNNTPTTQLSFLGNTPNIGNGLHNYTITCNYTDSNIDTTYASGSQTTSNSTPTINFTQAMQLLVSVLSPANNSVTSAPAPSLNLLLTGPYSNGYACYVYLDGSSSYYAYNTTVPNNTQVTGFTYPSGSSISNGAHTLNANCSYTDSYIDTSYASGSQKIFNVSGLVYFNQS